MNYEIVETDTQTILKRIDEDGRTWWIPMDESNSDYLAWLETEEGKTYLASKAE